MSWMKKIYKKFFVLAKNMYFAFVYLTEWFIPAILLQVKQYFRSWEIHIYFFVILAFPTLAR